METIPLPAYIHYELILQLLERKTRLAINHNSPQYKEVEQLIITLRKALAMQKQLEESCVRSNFNIEYRWSLNEITN
jgi:hypothetical protein